MPEIFQGCPLNLPNDPPPNGVRENAAFHWVIVRLPTAGITGRLVKYTDGNNRITGQSIICETESKVGIGTDTPGANLHIHNEATADCFLIISNIPSGDRAGGLQIGVDESGNGLIRHSYMGFGFEAVDLIGGKTWLSLGSDGIHLGYSESPNSSPINIHSPLYFGDRYIDGSFRMRFETGTFYIERLESGSWVEKASWF